MHVETITNPATTIETRNAILATGNLAKRAGAARLALWAYNPRQLGIGQQWAAEVTWPGRKLSIEGASSQLDAATAMGLRILLHAVCRCGHVISFTESEPGRCLWRLHGSGRRWSPACPKINNGRDLRIFPDAGRDKE